MARLRNIPRSEVTDPLVAYVYDHRALDGTDTETTDSARFWETGVACSPDVLEHLLLGIELCNGPAIGVDPVTRDLLKARVGWLSGSRVVYEDHRHALAEMNAPADKVDGIPRWELESCYSAAERAALAYTDCLVRGDGRIPDELFELLRGHYRDKTVLEMTYVVGYFIWIARMTRALQLGVDEGREQMTEIPPAREAAPRAFETTFALPTRATLLASPQR